MAKWFGYYVLIMLFAFACCFIFDMVQGAMPNQGDGFVLSIFAIGLVGSSVIGKLSNIEKRIANLEAQGKPIMAKEPMRDRETLA